VDTRDDGSEFLAGDDPTLDWLIPRLLAPGSVTNFFSPRGLGKTHVAYAYAVALARRGRRVLLLDRDNSKREIRRRLRAWGAADLTTLKVMTRDEVPPLTDAARWATFPWQEYDLVIVDSLDATAEGVGEQDSAKPAKAIAPLLDIAHRADGPAILVLGNTIKSGSHGRGSGVLEDRGGHRLRGARRDRLPTERYEALVDRIAGCGPGCVGRAGYAPAETGPLRLGVRAVEVPGRHRT
jgi:hypothetical protein